MGKRFNVWLGISGILLVILGIVCIFKAGMALETLAILAGIGFVTAAIADIVTLALFGRGFLITSSVVFDLVVNILIAILCFAEPNLVGAGFVWIVGAAIITIGIVTMIFAALARATLNPTWVGMGVLGALLVVCGIALLVRPTIFVVLIGVGLCIRGLINFISSFTYRKAEQRGKPLGR